MADDYNIDLDVQYGFDRRIDIPALVAATTKKWSNRSLTEVNDCVVRLGVIHGEFHWHKHDEEDEFFLVLEGRLLLDFEDEATVELGPHEAYTVSRGRLHRTRAPERTAILMVERSTVTPTGDPE